MVDMDAVRDVLEPQQCGRGHDSATMVQTNAIRNMFGNRVRADYTCTSCDRTIEYTLDGKDKENLRVVNRYIKDEGNMDP